jgi:thiol-disulfide isomerase/thioredoxin
MIILPNHRKGLKHMMRLFLSLGFFVTMTATSVAATKKLNAGPWLFELKTSHATVPFIINFAWMGDTLTGTIENGAEKIPLKNIIIKDDEITIPIQEYEITMELNQNTLGSLSGYLVRHNKNPIMRTPIHGVAGTTETFSDDGIKPSADFSGHYAVEIVDEDGNKSPGVLILNQKAKKLNGSLLTPTGDYRYFSGRVSANEFVAASFDGMFNYLIKGTIKDGIVESSLLTNYKLKISGKLDPAARLPDAYKHTEISGIDFTFSDLKGKLRTLRDKKFKNKAVIIQLFGSWCPNCMDEMNYLIPWYKKNKTRGVEIIALAFERSLEPPLAKAQLLKVQKQKQVPYTLLLAGSTAEEKPMDQIKGLKNFISFPTTIFLNRKHEVVKVHAGFTGPGTGQFYEEWKKEFNTIVDKTLEK